MAIQIVICVEAEKRSGTDNIYVKETLDKFYCIGNDVNINYINMGSKYNYNSKSVIRKINEFRKIFKIGDTVVIYCIDTDHFEKNQNHLEDFNKIKKYTDDLGYELVWFCHDIEEVYLGKSVVKDIKKDEALEFKKKRKIYGVDCLKIASNKKIKCRSNILNIFDKYLKRK